MDDQIEKNEVGCTCSTCILGFGGETDYVEDPDVDGRIILRAIFRKWEGGMYWFDLAQNRDRWRTLLNAVMNFRVPQNAGNFLTS